MIWETLKYLLGGLLVAACLVLLTQHQTIFAQSHLELIGWAVILVLIGGSFYTLTHDK